MTATLVLDKITLDAEGLKEVCRDDCSLTLDTTYRKIKKRALIMLQKIPPPSHTHVSRGVVSAFVDVFENNNKELEVYLLFLLPFILS